MCSPRSADEVAEVLRSGSRSACKVAIRGQAHSRYGQTLVEDGIVLDTRGLNDIGEPANGKISVGAGALLGSVVDRCLASGLTPAVMPDCLQLTVGGSLSAGGLGNTSQVHGAMIDNVAELLVVSGDGRTLVCSDLINCELFNMTLGGMGQCAVIVRATLELVPAPDYVESVVLAYSSVHDFIFAQKRAVEFRLFAHQDGTAQRGSDGNWRFDLHVGLFRNGSQTSPSTAELAAQLGGRLLAKESIDYRSYLYRAMSDVPLDLNGYSLPALAVWVPIDSSSHFVSLALEAWSELSPFNEVPMYALNTTCFRRPLLVMPSSPQALSVWLFRHAASDNRSEVQKLLSSNLRLAEEAVRLGGKLYAPYAFWESNNDWRLHFGEKIYSRLEAARMLYDPERILSPNGLALVQENHTPHT